MKTTVRKLLIVLTTTIALTGNTASTRQDGSGARTDPPPVAVQDRSAQATERGLILEREVYTYPARGRRNPFLPADFRPRRAAAVEGIKLLGIIHHPDPLHRVAVMSFGEGSGSLGRGEGIPVTRAASRLRIGEVLAGARIVAIEKDHVVVEWEEPGGTVPRVLSLPRAAQGRGS